MEQGVHVRKVPTELVRRAKMAALERGETFGQFVQDAISQRVTEHEGGAAAREKARRAMENE